MKSYTYLIGWKANDTWYYGVRTANKTEPADDLWRIYFTSSKYLRKYRKEYGEPDVVRIHKVFDDKNQAINFEKKFIQRVNAHTSVRWLNKAIPGKIPGGSVEQIAAVKGKRQTPEHVAKRIRKGKDNPMYGRTGTASPRFGTNGTKNPRWGIKHTQESIEKMKAKRATHAPMSDETKRKISEARRKQMAQKRLDRSIGLG